ncbi:MAG: PorT family protein [Bacteroidales bacterium]|nr:PorT family protein [Bacteroidales bacterium]MCF8387259.1 PorT family protein [Bacteroidales bacterium]MCF8399544.1 PorT family protein [Bacteroidales bacterium]
MIKTILPIFFLLCGLGNADAQKINIGAGISFGGPIPTEVIDSSSGKPLIGTVFSMALSFPINERLSFTPGLNYTFRGLDYSQSFTRDTLYTVEINGTSGKVPSFYTAYVNGKMRLHYIDIPLLFAYRIWKFQALFGPYISVLLAGRDAGTVRVVIGSGGFFEDYNEDFSNYHALRKIEQGLMLGSITPVYRNLSFEIKVSRSFFTLYNLDKLQDNGQGLVRMYNTYVQLGLVYHINKNQK